MTEAIPPSLGLGRLIGLDNMNKVLAAARRRVSDSHAAQMATIKQTQGIEFDLAQDTEDEEVAINVAGDTNNYTTAAASAGSAAAKLLTSAVLGAALPLAGIGGYLMLNDEGAPPTPAAAAPEFSVPDSEYEVIFYERQPDGSLKQIVVPRVGATVEPSTVIGNE